MNLLAFRNLSLKRFEFILKDFWNVFDVVTVVGSIVDAILSEFMVSWCLNKLIVRALTQAGSDLY